MSDDENYSCEDGSMKELNEENDSELTEWPWITAVNLSIESQGK